jgi:3-hydroxybutyryl-CoA dehydrogenase
MENGEADTMTSPASGTIAIVGNGVIGHGIAEVLAKGGWNVCLIGRSQDSLSRAIDHISSSLDEFIAAELLPASALRPRWNRRRVRTSQS